MARFAIDTIGIPDYFLANIKHLLNPWEALCLILIGYGLLPGIVSIAAMLDSRVLSLIQEGASQDIK